MLSAVEIARKSPGRYELTREVLDTFKDMAPIYLILNEVEATAGEAGYRLLSFLESEDAWMVHVMATTIHVFDLDVQLTRPGRFDVVALMPLPDEDERVELAKMEAERLRLGRDERYRLMELAGELAGATPAEIIDMVRKKGRVEGLAEALKRRFQEYMAYARHVENLPNGKVFRQYRILEFKGYGSRRLPRLL